MNGLDRVTLCTPHPCDQNGPTIKPNVDWAVEWVRTWLADSSWRVPRFELRTDVRIPMGEKITDSMVRHVHESVRPGDGQMVFAVAPRPTADDKTKKENRFGVLDIGKHCAVLSVEGWDSYTPPNMELYVLFFLLRNMLRFHWNLGDLPEHHAGLCILDVCREHPLAVTDLIEKGQICSNCTDGRPPNDDKRLVERIAHWFGDVRDKARVQADNPAFAITRPGLVDCTIRRLKEAIPKMEYFRLDDLKNCPEYRNQLYDFALVRSDGKPLFVHVCRSDEYLTKGRIGEVSRSLGDWKHESVILTHAETRGEWGIPVYRVDDTAAIKKLLAVE